MCLRILRVPNPSIFQLMRVVVSGANGFLGSWICRVLSETHQVFGFVYPKSDASRLDGIDQINIKKIEESNFNRAISAISPDVVILCDWWGVGNSFRNDHRQFENVERIRKRITSLKYVETVIGLGSQAELGPKPNEIDEIEDDSPTTLYGRAKVETRQLLEANLSPDVRFIWARIFSTYGPLDSDYWMIPSTIFKLLNKQRVPLTKGEQEWSFLHSYDVGRAFDKMVAISVISGIVNVGNSNTVTLSYVANFIGKYLKLESLLDFGVIPYRDDQVMKLSPITKKLCDVGWSPEVKLEDGIAHLIDWMNDINLRQLRLKNGKSLSLRLPSYLSRK